MRKNLFISLSVMISFLLICVFLVKAPLPFNNDADEAAEFRTAGKNFEIKEDNEWKPFKMVGVNLGTGYPGIFPNDLSIKKDVYEGWFEQIAQMNANTIRVYQVQSPAFYSAFLKYNKKHEKKLYLIQGIDFSDKLMYTEKNIFSQEIEEKLFKDAEDAINALHGDCIKLNQEDNSLNIYTSDVSPYVAGYTLGVEWDEVFVDYVCKSNSDKIGFNGNYFTCGSDATPFEIFLAQWAENVLSYEEKKYNTQKMISFANWAETDPLKNEIDINELKNTGLVGSRLEAVKNLEVYVDIERINSTDKVKAGMFAAYNIYPYYPLFLQYGKYTEYVDEHGQRNPYRAYLMELTNYHSCPVVVSEYGIPSSRSMTYADIWRDFSHGGKNEKEQGEILVKLFEDIDKAGCMGSFVFVWQDEWYKRAWNELVLSNPDTRAFWSNEQCVEQQFGILAFEPNKAGKTVYPDGDISDWKKKDIIQKNDNFTLSMKYDEKYVYFMVDGIDMRKNNSFINIAIDTLPNAGINSQAGKNYKRDVDFIIRINKDKSGFVYVDSEYDTLPYTMFDKMTPKMDKELLDKIKETYSPFSKPMFSGSDFKVVSRAAGTFTDFMKNIYAVIDVGALKFGNANPNSPDFVSNADMFIKDDVVELRVPWQVLNFYSPPECKIVDDFVENDGKIKSRKINKIYASAYYDDETDIDFGAYKLKKWNNPTFHERLKPVYYSLQKAFGEVN